MPVPNLSRKKLPTPFSRPAIEIGGHGKEWRDIEVTKVRRDDLILALGGVARVDVSDTAVVLEFMSGTTLTYPKNHVVNAFVERR